MKSESPETMHMFGLHLLVTLLLVFPLRAISADGKPVEKKDDWSSLKTGKDVYFAACVACHGTRGQGADPTMLGFDPGPPDFTDCKFTSRERTSDWTGIATYGGPIKGFSAMMPAFGEALSREQINDVVAFVKEFCPESGWPPGEFNLPTALNTGKAFPEDEIRTSVSGSTEDPVSIKGKLLIAARVAARHQIEAILPVEAYRFDDESEDDSGRRWGKGGGDIGVAWKSVLWLSRSAGNIGGVSCDVFFPTGNRGDGIGTGTVMFEPALRIGQIIPRVGFLQLQGGAELFADTERHNNVVFWRAVFGRTFKKGGVGRAFSPMIEVLGEKELSEESPEAEWSLVPQFQLALSKRQHIRIGTGLVIPATDSDTRPMDLMAYLIWDWYDGGFTEGWK